MFNKKFTKLFFVLVLLYSKIFQNNSILQKFFKQNFDPQSLNKNVKKICPLIIINN